MYRVSPILVYPRTCALVWLTCKPHANAQSDKFAHNFHKLAGIQEWGTPCNYFCRLATSEIIPVGYTFFSASSRSTSYKIKNIKSACTFKFCSDGPFQTDCNRLDTTSVSFSSALQVKGYDKKSWLGWNSINRLNHSEFGNEIVIFVFPWSFPLGIGILPNNIWIRFWDTGQQVEVARS